MRLVVLTDEPDLATPGLVFLGDRDQPEQWAGWFADKVLVLTKDRARLRASRAGQCLGMYGDELQVLEIK